MTGPDPDWIAAQERNAARMMRAATSATHLTRSRPGFGWQLSPAQSVMVGDFHFDLQTGRAAGSNTCLVHPQNQWPELADWHAVDCRNLLALL